MVALVRISGYGGDHGENMCSLRRLFAKGVLHMCRILAHVEIASNITQIILPNVGLRTIGFFPRSFLIVVTIPYCNLCCARSRY